jgi:hypothetical protein
MTASVESKAEVLQSTSQQFGSISQFGAGGPLTTADARFYRSGNAERSELSFELAASFQFPDWPVGTPMSPPSRLLRFGKIQPEQRRNTAVHQLPGGAYRRCH